MKKLLYTNNPDTLAEVRGAQGKNTAKVLFLLAPIVLIVLCLLIVVK